MEQRKRHLIVKIVCIALAALMVLGVATTIFYAVVGML